METNIDPMIKKKLRFSVIVPLFNKELYVKRCIDSILNQIFPDLEVIVVDDGSTDNGAEVVEKIEDSRVRLIRQPNGGVSAARNRGISEAKGEIITFLDADDEWFPDFLSSAHVFLSQFPEADVFTSSTLRIINEEQNSDFTGYVRLPEGWIGFLDPAVPFFAIPHPST